MSGVVAELVEESELVQNLEASQADVFDSMHPEQIGFSIHSMHALQEQHACMLQETDPQEHFDLLKNESEQNELIDFQAVFLFSWNRQAWRKNWYA